MSLTITPFWHRRPQIFPQVCYHHELNEITEQMTNLSFISLECIHGIEENIIFTNKKRVAMYVRSTLQENGVFARTSVLAQSP